MPAWPSSGTSLRSHTHMFLAYAGAAVCPGAGGRMEIYQAESTHMCAQRPLI